MPTTSRGRPENSRGSTLQASLCDLNAVGTTMFQKRSASKASRTASTPALPPTRGSAASTNFGATRESTASTSFRTTRASTFLATLPPSRDSASSTATSLLIAARTFDSASTLPRAHASSPERSLSPAPATSTQSSARLPRLPATQPLARSVPGGGIEGIVGSRVKRHSIDERGRRFSRSDGFGQTILPPGFEKRPESRERLPLVPPGFSRPMTPESEAALEGLQEEDSLLRLAGSLPGSSDEKMLKVVPLTLWLQELGVLRRGGASLAMRKNLSDGDLTQLHGGAGFGGLGGLGSLLVHGRSAVTHYNTDPLPVSKQKRARLDRAFVEHLSRIAQERDLRPMGDVSEELQIFRLKLHDRQARRRLHDIFGSRRRPRRVPEPVFANVVAVDEPEPPKPRVREVPIQLPSFDDVLIPSKPRPVIAEPPPVKETVTPTAVVQTPPAARKPWTPKKQEEEEYEEPEVRPVVLEEEPEEPLPEVEKPKPRPPTYTPQPSEKKEARRPGPAPAAVIPEPEKVPEVVVEPRGLFRIKDETPNLGMAFYSSPLLFPQLKEEKRCKGSKARAPTYDDVDDERPTSEGLSSQRPPSQPRRRRFNLAQEFREAIALAWERALAEVEIAWSMGPAETTGLARIHKMIGEGDDDTAQADSVDETCPGESQEPDEEDAEATDEEADAQEDAENKESMEQFSSVFARSNSVCSQESSSLAESVKRVQRKRYAKRLDRRTGNAALKHRTQRCWTQRVEVCRRLLVAFDHLHAKATSC